MPIQPLKDSSVDNVAFLVSTTSDTQTIPFTSTGGATWPVLGRTVGSYAVDGDHYIYGRDFTVLSSKKGEFSLSFSASGITVVNRQGVSFKAGTTFTLALDRGGFDLADSATLEDSVIPLETFMIDLGIPVTADADGYCVSQDLTSAGVFSIGVTAAAVIAAAALAGIADVPRNVVAAWTGTAVLTVTGTDKDGNVISQASASGTSLATTKAFKTITGISTSANITGLTVGTGAVLGLPVFIENAGVIIRELVDNAVVTNGTFVVGVTSAPTTTSGDVRGTYSPNSAPNSARRYQMYCMGKSKYSQGITPA